MDEPKERATRPGRQAGPDRGAGATRGGGPAEMGNALELLRIATTFFVLLYHAALAYLATPMRLTLWVAYDAGGHAAFDHFVYWVNGFAMPVFFLASGVSAPAACASRGPRVFLTSRVRRLLRPLLFGSLTILPITYLAWGYGQLVTGRVDLEDILRWRFSPQVSEYLYGWGHLWFLEYLFLVSVLWCGGWSLRRSLFPGPEATVAGDAGVDDGRLQRLLASPWRPFGFAIPTALIFLLDSDTMLRVDNAIVPNVFRVLHYAYFFAVGGWISRVREPRRRFIPYSTLYLVGSFALFAVMAPLLIRHASAPLGGSERVVFCLLAALFPWLTVFGCLGVFMRTIAGKGPVLRFLGESSFWVYLIHLPIIALMQIVLLPLAWPIAVKFLIVAAVATVASLLSYEYIVRRSLVGAIVNGARKRTVKRGFFGPEFGWIATLGVLALVIAGCFWNARVFFWGNNLYEEVPGRLYRGARLSARDLDDLIRRKGLRSVVAFTGGGERHPWYVAQKRVCQARGVGLYPINLRADGLPTRHVLNELLDVLDRCPRPVLVQGHRGIDQSGFAAAVALLLDGNPPREALRQFDVKYGRFGGPERSPLGQIVLDYQGWLDAHHLPHVAARFRSWARQEYLIHTVPTLTGDVRYRGSILARGGGEPALAR